MAAIGSLLKKLVSDAPSVTPLVRAGREEAFKNTGTNSLTAGIPLWIAKKLRAANAARKAGFGVPGQAAHKASEEGFEHGLYEKFHRPLKNVDEKAGGYLAGHGIGKNLFRHVDELPTSRTIEGHKATIKHETHSLTAPIAKGVATATPFLAAAKVGDIISKRDKVKKDNTELMKEAADKLASYDLRDRAIKVAFDLVEQKKCKPFDSLEAFETKVASIVEKGPELVAEALSLQPLEQELGALSTEKTAGLGGGDPAENFFHTLAG